MSYETTIIKLDDADGCACAHGVTAKGDNSLLVGTFELPKASSKET